MEIRRELSRLITMLKDPRVSGVVSVSRVETARDLSACKVYVSALERSQEVIKGLKSASGFLRRELGGALRLRHVPELVFVNDESIKQGAHILALLEKTKDTPDGENENG
jgi:ribosome-binding factor A